MRKFAMIIILFSITAMAGCSLSNQRMAKKMIEKYSIEQNYVALSGEIIEFNQNNVVIKCEEIKNYISYEDDVCEYYVYSDEILDLKIGDQIDFVTAPFHFYNGHKLPIIEVKKDGCTLLPFEDGKNNLIEWVNTNFK